MSANPQFASIPLVSLGQVSVANANLDGTSGTSVEIANGSTNGTRIDEIIVQAVETVTNGMVRLFLHDASTGEYRLWKEVEVSATTPSATVSAFRYSLKNTDLDGLPLLLLPNGWNLRATTHNAETFNIICIGGDF